MTMIQDNSIITLGLDIGKASIGFALIDRANNYKIITDGIRIFDAPENPKDSTSLNLKRGEYRRARNSQKNEFHRTKQVVKTLLKYKLLDAKVIQAYNKSPKVKNCPKSKKKRLFYIKTAEYLFYKKSSANDVLRLRVKALEQKLSHIEFARLLYSMNKHRGVTYDDIVEVKNAKAKGNKLSDDQKKLRDGFEKYNKEFGIHKEAYKTVGEYLYKNYKNKFRNTKKDYLFSIPQDDLKEEIGIVFEKQRELGNSFATKEFEREYLEWFLWEEQSPDYDILVAPCFYNKDEKSAHKNHFVSQLYISLEKLYNLRFRNIKDKEYQELSLEQKRQILDKSFSKKSGISYTDIKKILNFKDIEFKGVVDEKAIVVKFDIFYSINKILKLDFNPLEEIKQDNNFFDTKYKKVIEILAYKPRDTDKRKELEALSLSSEEIEELLNIKIRGHLSYSYDVVKKLCSYMLEGLTPHKAKEEIENEYGTPYIEKSSYLPPILDTDFPLTNNHTVIRALSQVRYVVNDILKYYRKQTGNSNWTFDEVIIELSREMNTKKQQSAIQKEINNNEKTNKEAKEFCEKYNIYNPTSDQILKAKLWLLQGGIDPYIWIKNDENLNVEQYTLGRLEASKLFDEDYCQIEHTLPIRRSLDNSQSNKTLVLTRTNQNKGNQTPYEYLNEEEFKRFEAYLKEKKVYEKYGSARVRKLLTKDFKGVDGFVQKDINNTQIISKYAGLYIDKYLRFWNNPNFKGKRRVYANNGKITSILRNAWAIGKKNRDNHLHHGEDAILIACSTPSLVKNISTFIGLQTELTSSNITKERFEKILKGHNSLKTYIIKELDKQNISFDDKNITSYIFKIIAKKNYPYDGFIEDFKKAIQNAPVTHFVKRKTNGAIHDETISSMTKAKSGIEIRDGLARNGEYVRYDVFEIKNSKGKITYNFVTITAQHYGKSTEELPTPILKPNESATFMFSVYKNDLLSYNLKDSSKIVGNFVKVDSSIILKEPKNLENNLFKKQLKGFNINILSSDDISNFEQLRNEILELSIQKTSKQKKTSNWKLTKLCNFTKLTTLEAQKNRIVEIIEAIKKLLPNINFIFYMGKATSNQTQSLKSILIDNKLIENNMKENINLYNTIFITFSEIGYLEALRTDGKTDIKDLIKIKVNCMGEIIEKITYERREPLL